jgi:hypothetical protein
MGEVASGGDLGARSGKESWVASLRVNHNYPHVPIFSKSGSIDLVDGITDLF